MDVVPVIPDFVLIRLIGSGSYGDVWLARSVTGIYRAVKIVHRSRFSDNRPFLREFDGIKRFQKAAGGQQQQLALLHVGYDEQAGVLYYVMELADDVTSGTDIDANTYVPATLKELHRRRTGPFPISQCVSIGADLASALTGLHKVGLIHRDVKPSNIIFVGGIPKLADVGLVASTEQTLTSLGTPGYAPPEGGGNVQGDIYSLGKILYELATGLGPDDFPRIPLSLMSGDSTPQLLEFNEIILRACDPDPTLRYPTAQALVEEIRLLQAGRSVKELNRNRRRLRLLTRTLLTGGLISLVALTVLGAKNYLALRALAQKEVAIRQLAEADDHAARYTADMHLARLGLSAADFGKARAALRRQIPPSGTADLRGFEWYALWNETQGDSIEIGGAVGGPPVTALSLSLDERFLAAQEGERDRDTVVWDLGTKQRTLYAHKTRGLGGFNAEGSQLTVGEEDRHLLYFQRPSRILRTDSKISGRILQALPDHRTLLLSDKPVNSRLMVWDLESQQIIGDWRPQPRASAMSLSAAALSQDHGLIAASLFCEDATERHRDLIVYDLYTRAERFHLTDIDRVQWLRFSPDSRWLAVAMWGQPTRIVSAIAGETKWKLSELRGSVSVVEFSPDGRLLASAGADRSVYVWNIDSQTCLKTFRGHEEDVVSLCWFSDSTRLISGSRDGTWRIWSLSTKSINRTADNLWSDVLGDFVFAPDGRSLAITDRTGELAILDTYRLERIETITGAFQPLFYEDNGRTLIALSKQRAVTAYDFSTKTIQTQNFHLETGQRLVVVEATAKQRRVGFGFDQGALEVWDLGRGVSFRDEHFDHDQIVALTWAPDKPELVQGGFSGRLIGKSFDPFVYPPNWTGPGSIVYRLDYSKDGELLAIGRADGRVLLESPKTGEILSTLEGHSAPISALTFSPDGSRLVSASADGMIIFWSVKFRRSIAVWTWDDDLHSERKNEICRLRFDPTGKRLGAMSEDGQFRIWDATQ